MNGSTPVRSTVGFGAQGSKSYEFMENQMAKKVASLMKTCDLSGFLAFRAHSHSVQGLFMFLSAVFLYRIMRGPSNHQLLRGCMLWFTAIQSLGCFGFSCSLNVYRVEGLPGDFGLSGLG